MSRQRIPPRDPAGHVFTGSLLEHDNHYFLALTPLPEATPVLSGSFIIRYGFRYYGKPHWAIVPGIVALDYGDMLTGQNAWDFVYKKSNLYPRADVVGYRNDGTDEMIPLKTLDIASPIAVLAYPDAHATTATAMIDAFIGPVSEADSAQLPPGLLDYLPVFESIVDWQNQ
ncbi:MAG: hypothetical protein OHK0046_34620 [Anaerolineae bacterium]